MEGLPEGEQSTVSPAWAKGESSTAPDRGSASELPQSVTPRDEAQQGMVQVTPTLAKRPRVRGGSGDTWRYRSLHCRKDPGRLERDPGSPDLRGESALRVGRCWSGEGLEIGRRGGRWTVCKPRPAGWGGSSCAGGREGADSWAVVEGQHGGGDWFVETPPRSTLKGERVPVSSGWGSELLSRIGGVDSCWDGDEGCFPTRVKVGTGDMTRRVLFPGPGGPS